MGESSVDELDARIWDFMIESRSTMEGVIVVGTREERQDITATVMARCADKLRDVPPDRWLGYLVTATKNSWVDYIRRQVRARKRGWNLPKSHAPDPKQEEQLRIVEWWSFIDSVPYPSGRDIVKLYALGFTHAEIGECLGKSTSAVKTLHCRFRKAARKAYPYMDFGEDSVE